MNDENRGSQPQNQTMQEQFTEFYNNMMANQQALIMDLRNEFLSRFHTLETNIQSKIETPTPNNNTREKEVTVNNAKFSMPHVPPPGFDGSCRSKPAHELQRTIDEYLARCLQLHNLYNLPLTMEHVTQQGQPTLVQFIELGLAGHAFALWRQIPIQDRKNMAWADYVHWVQNNFGSVLTFSQALEAFDNLVQKGPVPAYTDQFNTLLAALTVTGEVYTQRFLCAKYLRGLKLNLKKVPDLFKITDDLKKLQDYAATLDDITFRYERMRPVNTRPPMPTFVAEPMDLTNAEGKFQRLTNEQKRIFREKKWCTYCQEKDHQIEACPRLKEKQKRQEGRPPKGELSNIEDMQNETSDATNSQSL